ncbi:uncharacterized protein LOC117607534 isoform X8 [Osmia lignaria lignaria]|uniref:uncharacterized protein LOC117607534 isoform X8 n=1 Tax=Osmia lignaria lignaria TaxID=1437193 RepID=UPI001478C16A|nr:uncharacterized protein LOC117607534 isoform X8 [Osmia lignaria]
MPGVCPRCNREVYFAEEKLALGKVWHTFCFSCCNCRKLLNSCNVVTYLGELFCKSCYVRLAPSITNHEIKGTSQLLGTLTFSNQESNGYCCPVENSIGNASLNREQHYQTGKCRLRGGGSEVEETNVCLDEEKKHFLENEYANVGIVNSMTTICDPPPSPTAVTTWYNRQHCKLRSTLSLESQKNNAVAKDYRERSEVQEAESNQSELKTAFSNDEVNITEALLSTSDCCDGEEDSSSKCNELEKNRGQDRCAGNTELHPYRTMNDKDGSSKEETITCTHQSGPNSSNDLDDSERMRGGCGGPCGPRPRILCGTLKPVETICHCTKREPEPCRTVVTSCACSSPCIDRRGCCPSVTDRPICKKPIIRCRQPCTVESPGCGSGGCCGSGCRGGCGKPGQTCLPSRQCAIPPCRPCSPCSSPRPCPPQPICCCRKCGNCCGSGGGTSCCRPKSPVCRVRSRRCYSSDRAECADGGCCRPKSGCECLGGGLDCQRCGRKVYQAEMQIVSGIPFHNICFSCYCCRKPLESLTYQENCGEIYCKQCYVRNFGPQGYGYGVGPGALQTPM